ncbi:hypothetical protein PGS49_22845, partial [Yersinia intermedia]|uniref:hypothetical protein n=1 Tax=Yersinia intermedia TaxID=631 RepID=UPI0022FE33FC
AQRTRTHTQHRAGRGSMTPLAGLILAALTVPPAWSAVTAPPTGPINGTVPFLKTEEPDRSRLYVADQDGNTVGTTPENSTVNMDHTPSSFKASTTETLDIFPDDLDGDCDTTGTPPRQACDVAVGGTTNRVWKYNDVTLTPGQLSSAFKTYFAGKTLTVTVTAPVTTTSHTGDPTVGTHPLSSDETLVYVPVVPGIYTGVYSGSNDADNYYWDPLLPTSFPTTAALGLNFTVYMGENQSDYKFETDQPSWTTVGLNSGVVKFTAAPTSGTKTVKIKVTQTVVPYAVYTYTFTVNKWFDFISGHRTIAQRATLQGDMTASCVSHFGADWRVARLESDMRVSQSEVGYRRVTGQFGAEWGGEQPVPAWRTPGGHAYAQVYAASVVTDGVNEYAAGVIDSSGGNQVIDFPTPAPRTTFKYSNKPGAAVFGISADGYAPPYPYQTTGSMINVLSSGSYTLLCVRDL